MPSRLAPGLLSSSGEVGFELDQCKADGPVGSGVSLSELQCQMDCLGIPARDGPEAELSEYF
jgi:hypothetical protein